MTAAQKETALTMRLDGLTIKKISAKLGVSQSTLKSHFARNQDPTPANRIAPVIANQCAHCGKHLIQRQKTKPRRFCNAMCRELYWRRHRDQHQTPNLLHIKCAHCGKEFTCYGNKNRRFCSCQCFADSRKAVIS